MIGTPPRISTKATRATPPLVRGIKAITSGNASRGAGATMIKGVIIVNNLGVVRLAKFYEQVHVTGESAEAAQQSVIKKIYMVKNSRVHPKHWLISTQVLDEIIIGGLVLDTSITNIMGGADDQNKLHKSSLSLLTSGPKKTQIGARPGTLSGGYQ